MRRFKTKYYRAKKLLKRASFAAKKKVRETLRIRMSLQKLIKIYKSSDVKEDLEIGNYLEDYTDKLQKIEAFKAEIKAEIDNTKKTVKDFKLDSHTELALKLKYLSEIYDKINF